MARYVEDTFARTVGTAGNTPGTWGTADTGGAWTVSTSSGVLGFRTDGTRGRVEWVSGSGGSGQGLLSSAQPALDVHGAIHARLNIATQLGSGVWWARCSGPLATFTGYGIRLGRTAAGLLLAELVRGPQDAAVVIGTLAGVAWPDYTVYWRAELEVTGANPTTIRGRWFPASSPPADDSGWTTVTDNVGPQAAGVYGFRGGRTGSVATEYYVDTLWMADPLRPAFTASPGADGLTVTFVSSTLTGGDPGAHGWTFGDGSDAVVADPVHVYAAPGTYTVTYTAWTRWGTRRTATQTVVVEVPPLPDVRPSVYIGGEDVCDRVYSVSWRTGRDRWPDDMNGSSVTISLRGRMSDVNMGVPVVIAAPPGAPGGARTLFTGEVDNVTESVEPVDATTTTTIVAMDVMSFLSRWHILPSTTMPEGGLPTRVLSLAPRGTTVYRQKWAGVASSRWPVLKSLSTATSSDGLRKRTYLDVLRDGLKASLATAYVAPDGAVVYAPFDPPASLVPPVVDLDAALDCADHEDIEKSTAEGMINRWTVGGDPPAVDSVQRPSIESYGESQWSVSSGILKVDSTFPLTTPVIEQLREPFPARVVRVPIRSWSQLAWKIEPLDICAMGGVLYGVMGVRHQVGVHDWSVELALDRDPWTMTGAAPPVTPPAVHTATQTFDCSKDALLASPDMGAGKSTRLPVGYYSGTKYRALIQFDLDWAHTPKKVVLAELLLDTAGQDSVAYGSNPQIQIDRITGSWSEGGSGGSGPPWTYSTQNAVVYPGPSVTSTGRKSFTVTNNENTALTLAMTEICRSWADGSSNRGIRIVSQDESSSSRTIEFYSREHSTSSRRPQLRVTYEY